MWMFLDKRENIKKFSKLREAYIYIIYFSSMLFLKQIRK